MQNLNRILLISKIILALLLLSLFIVPDLLMAVECRDGKLGIIQEGRTVQISKRYGCHAFEEKGWGYAAEPAMVKDKIDKELTFYIQIVTLWKDKEVHHVDVLEIKDKEVLQPWDARGNVVLFKLNIIQWLWFRTNDFEAKLFFHDLTYMPIFIPSYVFCDIDTEYELNFH
jgi:hypothetical protein